MSVSIDQKWLHAGWEWFVGVHSDDLDESECRELLRRGILDWKMGSSQEVDLIFKHGLPGVEQVELESPPRALPSRRGWIYYKVRREGSGWSDVLATQTLAIRFKDELINNLDKLTGQQKLEVKLSGRRPVLRFALFAVPPQQK
jgi:predicted component of type VI protein secretion system